MSAPLPSRALSIRQPWAWLIVNGWKNIENRNWRTSYRGPVLIHAAKGMTQAEYNACRLFMSGFCDPDRDVKLPHPVELERGGIVGVATILDCVEQHPSEWFSGEWGFVLTNARPLPFMPLKGELGFFTVHRDEAPSDDASLPGDALPAACPDCQGRGYHVSTWSKGLWIRCERCKGTCAANGAGCAVSGGPNS
jgi:hypothetical protein